MHRRPTCPGIITTASASATGNPHMDGLVYAAADDARTTSSWVAAKAIKACRVKAS